MLSGRCGRETDSCEDFSQGLSVSLALGGFSLEPLTVGISVASGSPDHLSFGVKFIRVRKKGYIFMNRFSKFSFSCLCLWIGTFTPVAINCSSGGGSRTIFGV
jgi:hypothetical protein